MLVFFRQQRFHIMLAFMVLLMVQLPVMNYWKFGHFPVIRDALNTLFFSLLLIFSIYSINGTRRSWLMAISLVGLGIVCKIMYLLFGGTFLFVAYHTFYIIFLAIVIYSIVQFLFQNRQVDSNMISASLCCFLLLGLFWAVLYSLTAYLAPDSFHISVADGSVTNMYFGLGNSVLSVYYSYVTLTTLGYGDMYPVSSISRMLAALEALTGQLYLVVIVARLVGLHIAHGTKNE